MQLDPVSSGDASPPITSSSSSVKVSLLFTHVVILCTCVQDYKRYYVVLINDSFSNSDQLVELIVSRK